MRATLRPLVVIAALLAGAPALVPGEDATLVTLGIASALGAQDVQMQPFRPQQEIAQDPTAARLFSTFAKAWAGRRAEVIAELIPADGRASVTIESRGVRSQMSRGQVEALLTGLFSEAERMAFSLSTTHMSDETSAYAVGDWQYESRNPPRRQREKVFVSFQQMLPGSWVLSELRIQPAR